MIYSIIIIIIIFLIILSIQIYYLKNITVDTDPSLNKLINFNNNNKDKIVNYFKKVLYEE